MALILKDLEVQNDISEEEVLEIYNRAKLRASQKPINAVIFANKTSIDINFVYEAGFGYFRYALKEDGDYEIEKEKESFCFSVIDTEKNASEPADKETADTESVKNDFADKKPRWDLLPIEELGGVVDVYTAGAKKYGENRWQNLPNGVNRYLGALFRHLTAHKRGELFDPEDGCFHLDKCIWNMIAVRHCFLTDKGIMPNTSDYTALRQDED